MHNSKTLGTDFYQFFWIGICDFVNNRFNICYEQKGELSTEQN